MFVHAPSLDAITHPPCHIASVQNDRPHLLLLNGERVTLDSVKTHHRYGSVRWIDNQVLLIGTRSGLARYHTDSAHVENVDGFGSEAITTFVSQAPDGRIVCGREQMPALFVLAPDGVVERVIDLKHPVILLDVDWSDGCVHLHDPTDGLYALDLSTGKQCPPKLVKRDILDESIYVRPSGEATAFSTHPRLALSPDGRSVAHLDSTSTLRIEALDVSSEPMVVAGPPSLASLPRERAWRPFWSVDSRFVGCVLVEAKSKPLSVVSSAVVVVSLADKTLFMTSVMGSGYALSPL